MHTYFLILTVPFSGTWAWHVPCRVHTGRGTEEMWAYAVLYVGEIFLSAGRACRSAPDLASQFSLHKGFCLPLADPAMSFSPVRVFLILQPLHIACEMGKDGCLQHQKLSAYRDGDLKVGGFFPLFNLGQKAKIFLLSFVHRPEEITSIW